MHRKIILPVLLVVFGFVFFQLAYASFEDDYKNFLRLSDQYRQAHAAYINTRSQYLQYGTLNSKNEALNAAKTFLTARNDVLLSHLTLLRQSTADPGLTKQLEDHVNFLQESKLQVTALGSLEDIVEFSQTIEERHVPLLILSRQVVATLVTSKVDDLKLRFLVLENEATQLVAKLREQDKDVAVLERWLLDARNKRLLAEGKIRQARELIAQFSAGNTDDVNETYNSIEFTLFEAGQYLREGLAFTRELSEAIKYGNY